MAKLKTTWGQLGIPREMLPASIGLFEKNPQRSFQPNVAPTRRQLGSNFETTWGDNLGQLGISLGMHEKSIKNECAIAIVTEQWPNKINDRADDDDYDDDDVDDDDDDVDDDDR